MKIGYIRVSSEEQNLARQEKIMQEYGIEKIFAEKVSGAKSDREQLKNMIDFARSGDIVYVESISRASRSVRDLLKLIDTLTAKGVEFVSIKEAIDTTTPQGRFVLTIFGALSELERENIRERAAQGIAIAKAQGKYKGRKPISIDEAEFNSVVTRWKNNEITAVRAQKLLNLKPSTFYRRVREQEGR